MLTYQIRPRVLRLKEERQLSFPGDGYVTFTWAPLQAFGAESGGGRTAVRAVAASVLFNANTGEHTIESKTPLCPLEVEIEEPNRRVELIGNVLTIRQHFTSNQDLTALIEGVYFGLPPLLNVEFADPPLIERVDGAIGDVQFRWELADWKCEFRTTTQEEQKLRFVDSWNGMNLLSKPTNTRLFAALHFYYVAVRLRRQGQVAGEFLSESILNFAKVLETLFPPNGDGRTRDAVRRGLEDLGFTEEDREGDYLPAMALRNEIDVGHVDLGLFEPEHLKLIHGYVDRAEYAFHELLHRVLTRMRAGEYTVTPYTRGPVRQEALAVVNRIARYADRYAL